jgi:hypothetical protein
VPARRHLRRLRKSRSSQDRRAPVSVKIREFERSEAPSIGRTLGLPSLSSIPVSRLSTRGPRETFTRWSDGQSSCRRERSGEHLAMPSEKITLDRAPAYRQASVLLKAGIAYRLLWATTALPRSATHVRRAGTPASRESSSARGCRLCPRSPSSAVARRTVPPAAACAARSRRAPYLVLPLQVFLQLEGVVSAVRRARPMKAVR